MIALAATSKTANIREELKREVGDCSPSRGQIRRVARDGKAAIPIIPSAEGRAQQGGGGEDGGYTLLRHTFVSKLRETARMSFRKFQRMLV